MTEQEEKFARTCRIYKLNDMEWREFEEDYAKNELKLTDEQIKNILNENYYEYR